MKYHELEAIENSFFTNTSYLISPLKVAIQGSSDIVTLHQVRRKDGIDSYFFKDTRRKDRIFLHFTAGYLGGDVVTLTKQNHHVSVPFIVARSGKILQLFQSAFWSYHLGPAAIGGNEYMSSSSIAIEISNIGPLVREGDVLYTSYRNKQGALTTPYCSISDKDAYVKKTYRGYQYFAKFSKEQYEATALLIRLLLSKYPIKKRFLPQDQLGEVITTEVAQNFCGILTHTNVRSDKQDIGPAFDWGLLMKLLEDIDDA
jgi:N-acetylmuramoyl-L-alanine amidase